MESKKRKGFAAESVAKPLQEFKFNREWKLFLLLLVVGLTHLEECLVAGDILFIYE